MWFAGINQRLDGVYYDYLVTAAGNTRRTADPYARACGLNGQRSMVVDLAATDPEGWQEDKAPARQPEDIIYEVHVREFSWAESGRFPGALAGQIQSLLLRGHHPVRPGQPAHRPCISAGSWA